MQATILSPTNPLYPPASNTLIVDSLFGLPYNYRWCLAKVTSAGSPPVATTLPLVDGNGAMSQAQWDAWTSQDDQTYILTCVATNLGVVLA